NSGFSSACASLFGLDVMAPNKPSLCLVSRSMVRSGSALPWFLQHSQPMSAWMYWASKPTAWRTRNASGRTWFPIPSPGIVTTVCLAMNVFLLNLSPQRLRDTEVFLARPRRCKQRLYGNSRASAQAQTLCHQILYALGDD